MLRRWLHIPGLSGLAGMIACGGMVGDARTDAGTDATTMDDASAVDGTGTPSDGPVEARSEGGMKTGPDDAGNADEDFVACAIDAACGTCCAALLCYGGRCCLGPGSPCDAAAQCCSPHDTCVGAVCVLTGQ